MIIKFFLILIFLTIISFIEAQTVPIGKFCDSYKHKKGCLKDEGCVWCNKTDDKHQEEKCVIYDTCKNKGEGCSKENTVTSELQRKNRKGDCKELKIVSWIFISALILCVLICVCGIIAIIVLFITERCCYCFRNMKTKKRRKYDPVNGRSDKLESGNL